MNCKIYIFIVISDIGGFLGLFLGASLLSSMEIVFFVAAKVIELIKWKSFQKSKIEQELENCKKSKNMAELLADVKDLKKDVSMIKVKMEMNSCNCKKSQGNFFDDELSIVSLKIE